MTAFPDIGPAVTAIRLFRSPLKAVVIRITGFSDAQQVAEIIKMGLGLTTFAELVLFPQGDKLFRGHFLPSSANGAEPR
ncbi:MAG: hypothetical protein KJ630_05810 [Proteobacteria bacterium]|nr:hypothetical protein [Pseudomonadota bacterium]